MVFLVMFVLLILMQVPVHRGGSDGEQFDPSCVLSVAVAESAASLAAHLCVKVTSRSRWRNGISQ